ncbi:MAG TPA: TatD family hydrolase, partial [Acidobacteriota bacterium]|nr:TatD family hydrolase [Acidobacteriota bacterium]
MVQWLDAHTHLDSGTLYENRKEVLKRAIEAGLTQLLLVNSEASRESLERTLQVAGMEAGIKKSVALGIHPHHASLYSAEMESVLRELLGSPSIVALGEIGLDYYYNYSHPDVQKEALRLQLALARELNLPVVIHCRDAYGPLCDVLEEQSSSWRGMIHCFTGNVQEVQRLLRLGFHISFSGIVTFRTADSLRQAALAVPLDRLLIETDAPYLAPVPMRGKTNEPAYVVYTG